MSSADNTTVATEGSVDAPMSFVEVQGVQSANNTPLEVQGGEANSTTPALSISILPEHEFVGRDAQVMPTSHVCVSIQAKELAEGSDTRAPVDIIVALDVSASMTGDKIKLCKRTLQLLLRTLIPRDRFGLITYSATTEVDVPPQFMTAANKAAVLQKIQQLEPRTSTNISSAIGMAFQEMHAIDEPNEVRSIFLLTDGLANAGITTTSGMVELTKNCLRGAYAREETEDDLWTNVFVGGAVTPFREVVAGTTIPAQITTTATTTSPPVSMFCFGYGQGHNAHLLTELADAASGSYYFVETDSNVGAAFGDALGGLLSVVAQNAVVTLQVAAEAASTGAEIVKVYHDQAIQRDNGTYTVNLGDFYAEESRDVVMQVKLASPVVSTPSIPHIRAFLSYTDTLQKRPVVTPTVVASIARPWGAEIAEAHTHVAVQCFRVLTTEHLTRADTMARSGDISQAQAVLQEFDKDWQSLAPTVQAHNISRELYGDVQKLAQGLKTKADFRAVGSKSMKLHLSKHKKQRTCISVEGAPTTPYNNSSMSTMRMEFHKIISPKKEEKVPIISPKKEAQLPELTTARTGHWLSATDEIWLECQVQSWSEDTQGNKKKLRELLSTLHLIVWPGLGWKPVLAADLVDDGACVGCLFRASRQLRAARKLEPHKRSPLSPDQRFLAKLILEILHEARIEFDNESKKASAQLMEE